MDSPRNMHRSGRVCAWPRFCVLGAWRAVRAPGRRLVRGDACNESELDVEKHAYLATSASERVCSGKIERRRYHPERVHAAPRPGAWSARDWCARHAVTGPCLCRSNHIIFWRLRKQGAVARVAAPQNSARATRAQCASGAPPLVALRRAHLEVYTLPHEPKSARCRLW